MKFHDETIPKHFVIPYAYNNNLPAQTGRQCFKVINIFDAPCIGTCKHATHTILLQHCSRVSQ